MVACAYHCSKEAREGVGTADLCIGQESATRLTPEVALGGMTEIVCVSEVVRVVCSDTTTVVVSSGALTTMVALALVDIDVVEAAA